MTIIKPKGKCQPNVILTKDSITTGQTKQSLGVKRERIACHELIMKLADIVLGQACLGGYIPSKICSLAGETERWRVDTETRSIGCYRFTKSDFGKILMAAQR